MGAQGKARLAQTLRQHWNSSWASVNTSTSRKSRSRWSTERRPWRSGAGGKQWAVSLHRPPWLQCPSPEHPRLCSPRLTGAEAPTVAVTGGRCLRWGTAGPGTVGTVARRAVDGARRLRGGRRLLSLPPFPTGGSRAQENHVITTTVWTHSRRFWRKDGHSPMNHTHSTTPPCCAHSTPSPLPHLQLHTLALDAPNPPDALCRSGC